MPSKSSIRHVLGENEKWTKGILTWPNLITLIRLVLVPVFIWLLMVNKHRVQAAILLTIVGSTDWVDGYLARRLGQESVVGKILDPAADRLLIGAATISTFISNDVPRWFCVLIAAREVLITLAVAILAAGGAKRIAVSWWGKSATFGLMCSFPLFILARAHNELSQSLSHWFLIVAYVVGLPSLLLSYFAAARYIPEGLKARRPKGLRSKIGKP